MSTSHAGDSYALSELEKQVGCAVCLLKKLSGHEKSLDVAPRERVALEDLRNAAGLAFFEATKAGLIITGYSGKGFLLQNVGGGWSAPLLFTLKSVGFGMSAGFSTSQTLLILSTERAVNDFLHTQISLNSEMGVAIGKMGKHLQDMEENLSDRGATLDCNMYSVAHGAMVDASFEGVKISINDKEMAQLYGPNVDVKTVLSGQQPQLSVLEPFVAELKTLC